MPWRKGQRTRALVLKEMAYNMKARQVGGQKIDKQESVLCKMQHEGTTATALVQHQATKSEYAVLPPTRGADHQIPEVGTVH